MKHLGMPLLLLLASCSDAPPLQLCGEIPEGGCPIGRGGTCLDPTCTGVYDCVGGNWTVTEQCTAPTTSAASSSGSGVGGEGGGAACGVTLTDEQKMHEAHGCSPGLESPDCPAVAAETCSACSGCEDFFVCWGVAADCAPGSAPCWLDMAYCDENGEVVPLAF